MKQEEIRKAITHLDAALSLLKHVEKAIKKGLVVIPDNSDQLATAWYKVNCCRLYTEDEVAMEDCNQSAMGLICDAKEMLDSLVAWNMGLTKHGQGNILRAMAIAMEKIELVKNELEVWLNNRVAGELSQLLP